MLRKIRIISQIFCTALFTCHIFLALRHPIAYTIPHDVLYASNPLVGILVSIAGRVLQPTLLITAAIMTIATIVFGRFFCGFMCPLGACIDFSDKFITRHFNLKNYHPPLKLQSLKYVLLGAVTVLALFGILEPWFFDPLSLITRTFTLILYPLSWIIGSDVYSLTNSIKNILDLDGGLYSFKQPYFWGISGALLLFLFILCSGIIKPRFWCQYVCPSGAFFGLVGQKAFFKRHTSKEKCSECTVCAKKCVVSAISSDNPHQTNFHRTNTAECIVCGVCTNRPQDCGAFGFGPISKKQTHGPDISRRHVMAGIVAGLVALPLFRGSASVAGNGSGRLIRPPGALPEKEFLASCITCGACMKVCPTNALQPCGIADGFNRMNTPVLVPRIGACEEGCSVCTHVCPTKALRKLPITEKPFVKMGTAVIFKDVCLAWEQNKECLVCDENCPFNAITMVVKQTTRGLFKVPVVDPALCMGCGKCEKHCPISDRAAIIVYSFGENRIANGSYMSDWQKESMTTRRKASDEKENSKSFKEKSDTESSFVQPVSPTFNEGSSAPAGNSLPPGFVE